MSGSLAAEYLRLMTPGSWGWEAQLSSSFNIAVGLKKEKRMRVWLITTLQYY